MVNYLKCVKIRYSNPPLRPRLIKNRMQTRGRGTIQQPKESGFASATFDTLMYCPYPPRKYKLLDSTVLYNTHVPTTAAAAAAARCPIVDGRGIKFPFTPTWQQQKMSIFFNKRKKWEARQRSVTTTTTTTGVVYQINYHKYILWRWRERNKCILLEPTPRPFVPCYRSPIYV